MLKFVKQLTDFQYHRVHLQSVHTRPDFGPFLKASSEPFTLLFCSSENYRETALKQHSEGKKPFSDFAVPIELVIFPEPALREKIGFFLRNLGFFKLLFQLEFINSDIFLTLFRAFSEQK